MRPFITFGGGQPEQGSVVLQWLNLVAGNEAAEQGKEINHIYSSSFMARNFL
jgi:hypothetical protein